MSYTSIKRYVAVAALVGFVGSVPVARGGSDLLLQNLAGFWDETAAALLPAGNLFQLIWTEDAAYADNAWENGDGSTQLDAAGYAAQSDYLLYEDVTPSNGGFNSVGPLNFPFGDPVSAGGGDAFPLPDGYVYGRVFGSAGGVNGALVGNNQAAIGGTWFFQTAIIQVTQDDSAQPPQTAQNIVYSAAGSGSGPGGAANLDTQVQVIPEPATWAFMGLGLVTAMAWRRRR